MNKCPNITQCPVSYNTHFVVGGISVLFVGEDELLALQDEELGANLEASRLRAALAIAHVHDSVVELLK